MIRHLTLGVIVGLFAFACLPQVLFIIYWLGRKMEQAQPQTASHPDEPVIAGNVKKGRPVGSGQWVGERLDRLRKAYEADEETTAAIACTFNVSTYYIRKLARRHGWKRRMSAEGIAALTAARRGRA